MGTFGGHALPGSFFILFGVWWTIRIFHRYHSCQRRNARFFSTATFTCTCLPGRLKHWPLEGMVKIFFVTIGFMGEIITGYRDGKFVVIGNAQHATMFFFFGINGAMDVLTHLIRAPVLVPPKIDYVSSAMALMCEALLFKFHLHGRTELNVLVHTLLLYTIYANTLAVLVEMKYGHNVLSPLARAYFIMLQGTWFWQIGFILHNPIPGARPWKEDDHEQMMIATLIFVWHAGAVFLLMLLIGGVIACLNHKLYKGYDADLHPLIHAGEVHADEAIGQYHKIHQEILGVHDDRESDWDIQNHVSSK